MHALDFQYILQLIRPILLLLQELPSFTFGIDIFCLEMEADKIDAIFLIYLVSSGSIFALEVLHRNGLQFYEVKQSVRVTKSWQPYSRAHKSNVHLEWNPFLTVSSMYFYHYSNITFTKILSWLSTIALHWPQQTCQGQIDSNVLSLCRRFQRMQWPPELSACSFSGLWTVNMWVPFGAGLKVLLRSIPNTS